VVPTLDRHSCVARASEIPVESSRRSSTNKEKWLVTSFTRVAISFMQHLRKGKSLALNIYDTFDQYFVKTPGECLFSSGHVIVCDFFDVVYLFSINFFFLKLSSKRFPLNGPRDYGDRWGKQPRVRRHESRPAVPLRWLARKYFFWPIRRREFKRFWNWIGKSKYPGALPLLLWTFAQENPVVPTSCPWVSEDEVTQYLLPWEKKTLFPLRTPGLQ